jgi:hypothetical protein
MIFSDLGHLFCGIHHGAKRYSPNVVETAFWEVRTCLRYYSLIKKAFTTRGSS